jgi:hypothetical protein
MMPIRMLTGRESIKAARRLEALEMRRDQWPYPHAFPPPSAQRVQREGTIAAPAVGTQTVVLAYTVPLGFRFWITDIVQGYSGAGMVPGRGDATWQLDKNSPIGLAPLQALVIDGFGASSVPFGCWMNGVVSSFFPWPLRMPELLEPNDVLRSKITTTVAITAGDPNYFTSMFLGWLVPAE